MLFTKNIVEKKLMAREIPTFIANAIKIFTFLDALASLDLKLWEGE